MRPVVAERSISRRFSAAAPAGFLGMEGFLIESTDRQRNGSCTEAGVICSNASISHPNRDQQTGDCKQHYRPSQT